MRREVTARAIDALLALIRAEAVEAVGGLDYEAAGDGLAVEVGEQTGKPVRRHGRGAWGGSGRACRGSWRR